MTRSDHGKQLSQIIADYLQAVEAGQEPDRDQLLADHPDVAEELREFLSTHDQVQEAAGPPSPPQEDATIPPRPSSEDQTLAPDTTSGEATLGTKVRYFGDYELLEEIARGGMGVVYKARQTSLNRIVALKMILAGQLAGEEDVQRFHAEAEAAANLDHPGIVPIYEIGEHEGQHYFAMGFVEGESLADRIKDGPLPPREAAEYTKKVAEAIAFAHERGVIHRDLKPANVLLDRNGEPKVTDFGLAKRVEGDSGLTATGQILGTPSYMPPEQASGKVEEITESADVYSLGAILYCLLVGRPPFQAASPLDTMLQVLEQEPVPPRQLNPQVDLDLQTIALKCLEKDASRRYESANDLKEELERFLNGEPIRARPISTVARAWRWSKRKPAWVGFSGTLLVLLLTLSIGGPMMAWRQAENARRQALLRRDADEQRSRADERTAAARRQLYISHMRLAERDWKVAGIATMVALLESHRQDDIRGFEWDYLWCISHDELLSLNEPSMAVIFTGDGKRLAYGSLNTVKVWNIEATQQIFALKGHTGIVRGVAFDPLKKRLASGSEDRTVKLWDSRTGQEVSTLEGHTHAVFGVAFSPDGKRLASGSADNTVRVWDAESGQLLSTLGGHTSAGWSVSFSPDGQYIASAGYEEVKVWNAESGKASLTLKDNNSRDDDSVAFSPDGKRLASASANTVRVWDTETGEQALTFEGHSEGVNCLAFSSDGERLASGSSDKTVRIWDAQTGVEKLVIKGHTANVSSVAFSPDGKRLASTANYPDNTVKVWDTQTAQGTSAIFDGHNHVVNQVAFSPDGKRLASASSDKTVRVWNAKTGQEELILEGHSKLATSVVFSPDGKRLASASSDKTVRVWAAKTGQEELLLQGHSKSVASLAFSPDGKRLASASWDKSVKVWNVESGQEFLTLEGHTDIVVSVACSPDGKRLASASRDNTVRVWDIERGQLLFAIEGYASYVAFSPGGERLAGSLGNTLKVWDAKTGQEILLLEGHSQLVKSVAFSADGERLVSASWDKTVRVWDAKTGQEMLSLEGAYQFNSAVFSPNGKHIASGTNGYPFMQVWDGETRNGNGSREDGGAGPSHAKDERIADAAGE